MDEFHPILQVIAYTTVLGYNKYYKLKVEITTTNGNVYTSDVLTIEVYKAHEWDECSDYYTDECDDDYGSGGGGGGIG